MGYIQTTAQHCATHTARLCYQQSFPGTFVRVGFHLSQVYMCLVLMLQLKLQRHMACRLTLNMLYV